jgi:D-ala D-ala ligase C-terminus/SET domain
MKICVLQPDYSTTSVDYKNWDPPRNLQRLLPGARVDHVFINKLTTYKQLKALAGRGYDCFVNLCEGYLHWEVPSIDVIYTLELLGLPFTGPTTTLYDPPKEVMKYVAYSEGIATPAYALVTPGEDLAKAAAHLRYPFFVKPAHAGDSLGVDAQSFVSSFEALSRKVTTLWEEYPEVLVEEYIDGREFTVLVAANAAPKSSTVFAPVEYLFPAGQRFKTYALKTSELHPECNVPVTETALAAALKDAVQRIFGSFGGVGYARMDFRSDASGALYFLEVNFTCSVFYEGGYEGSADHILRQDGIGQEGFLRHIIAEAIARHHRHRRKHYLKGNAIAGFGIYARTAIAAGEVIFTGEEAAHRLVTRRHVQRHWNDAERQAFDRYAWPISDEVYAIWDADPLHWAPQNHSCDANTVHDGLNVVAARAIEAGEELTLDYGLFLDERAAPFVCRCGAAACRGTIRGSARNSVTMREKNR